jgi:hypothetical protein
MKRCEQDAGQLGDEGLTEMLAERVMNWTVTPDRFLTRDRRWQPRWRFQPMTRLADALRLLECADVQEYTIGSAEDGKYWASILIGRTVGEAREPSQARAITVAIARALGIESNL